MPVTIALLALLLPAAVWTAQRVCREPVSVQPQLLTLRRRLAAPPVAPAASPLWSREAARLRRALAQLTGAAIGLKNQDRLAFPAHALIATTLSRLNCSPDAIAVQWLKAGAHAATPAQSAAVEAGLVRQAARTGGARELAAYLRQYLDPSYDPRGRCTIAYLEGQGPPPDQCR